jgi:hypothetical protein
MEFEEARAICGELQKTLGSRAKELHRLTPKKEFTAWTLAVKAVLEEIGSRTNKNYESLYSCKERDIHEFLVDFTWWDKKDKVTILACECEFGNTRDVPGNPERVGEDFDKLLSVKAFFKLMIFDSYESTNGKCQTQDILQNLQNRFRKFGQHTSGEIYVLLDTREWDDFKRNRLWQCVITRDGHDESLILSEFAVV